MHSPPHGGEVIRRQCLEPLGLTATAAAEGLGGSRKTLSMLVNGRLGIAPKWRSGSPRAPAASRKSWLRQQMDYDLWQPSKKAETIKVRKFAAA
jgi:antitoxin HigA-1